jgi:hypothetical protein
MANDFLLFPDDDNWGEFPDDFLDESDGQNVIDDLKKIRAAVGSPLQPLVTDLSRLTARGHASSLRGIRFTSGAQALQWLFHRGIFLFSNIVQMPDGTWGVSIRSSDEGSSVGDSDLDLEGEDDIVF